MPRDQGRESPQDSSPRNQRKSVDWWARSFALIGIGVAVTSLTYNIYKDRVALRENIEPNLECHVSPMHGPPYENLTFALRNASPISVASVVVDQHNFLVTTPDLYVIADEPVDTPYSPVPGFYWLTAQELAPGALLEKRIDPTRVFADSSRLTAAVFEVTFYRPGDMKRFEKECVFFLASDFVHTPYDFRLRPGYITAMGQIEDALTYEKLSRRLGMEGDNPKAGK